MHCVVVDKGMRDYMEDTWVVKEKFFNDMDLYCVFDGHGGDYVSNYLRDEYPNILLEVLREGKLSLNDALYISIKRTVEMIPKDKASTCGSTYLIAIRNGEMLYIANGGDCRAIINSNSDAVRITIDHKPTLEREAQRIQSIGGFIAKLHPMDVPRVMGNLAVSRSIGDFHISPYVAWHPDVFIIHLNKTNNFAVLASDGVWDTMSNEDVIEVFKVAIENNDNVINGDIIKQSSVNILIKARQRGSTDNITILVFALPQ